MSAGQGNTSPGTGEGGQGNGPAALASWLESQRWYGDKSRTIAHVSASTLATVAIGGKSVSLLDVGLEFTDHQTARYFVPVARHADGVVDALSDPAFLAWFGEGFLDGRRLGLQSDIGASMTWHSVAEDAGWTAEEPRLLQGEQSNSSVLFGTSAIVKVFRRLQPGINPDSEIVSYLTGSTTFEHVPRYLGSVIVERPNAESVELAAVQGFVENDGDSWRWLPPALESATAEALADLRAAVSLLGTRTGELHVALASGGNTAFEPQRIDEQAAGAIQERLTAEVRQTVPMLLRSGAVDDNAAAELEQSLLKRLGRTETLVGSFQTRVHGDYHLGQVLRAKGDFVIIDFEGEPSRTMGERRMRHSPLKDVAGMLRSIDYAVATARRNVSQDRRATLDKWNVDAQDAFKDAYRSAVSVRQPPLVPGPDPDFTAALDVFIIEKALYEVRYELDNRPDWLEIPFGALRKIVAQSA